MPTTDPLKEFCYKENAFFPADQLPFLQLAERTRWWLIGAGGLLFVVVLAYQLWYAARPGK
jgi:hypothetical protein